MSPMITPEHSVVKRGNPGVQVMLLSVAAMAALSIYALISNSTNVPIVVLALVLTAVEVGSLWRLASGFTPIVIPVLVINSVMTLGFLSWEAVSAGAAVSARLPADPAQLRAALTCSLWFTSAFTFGALLGGPRRVLMAGTQRARIPAGALLLSSFLILALRVYGRGFDSVLAAKYLEYSGPTWAASLGGALTPIALLMLCYAVSLPGRHRPMAVAGLLLWLLVILGASSRQVALIPGLLVLGRFVALGPPRRLGRACAGLAAAVVVTGVLAQLVLTLRDNPGGVGIVTLARLIWSQPDLLWSHFSPDRTLGNLFFSTPLVGRVAEIPVSRHAFWTSVSPLPSGFTDWTIIAPTLRLNPFTPYAGLGELATQGLQVLLTYGFLSGLILSLVIRSTESLPGAWRQIGTVAVMALITLFSVTLLQYNLRTGTRLLWYAAIATVAVRLLVGRTRALRPAVRNLQTEAARAPA